MRKLNSLPRREAAFIEPMECLAVEKLPGGPVWVYEIKLDGYRALAINAKGKLSLYSRKRKSFNRQYPHIEREPATIRANQDGSAVGKVDVEAGSNAEPSVLEASPKRLRSLRLRGSE
jgi:ATP-dependent DNA ligase